MCYRRSSRFCLRARSKLGNVTATPWMLASAAVCFALLSLSHVAAGTLVDLMGARAPNNDDYEIISKQEGDIYQKVILKDGLIMGMVFVGNIEKSGIIFGLMRDRVNVESFKRSLLVDDFGLAFFPKALWQERLALSPDIILQPSLSIEAEEETFLGE